MYQHVKVPAAGQKITVNKDFSLNVPENPIIPFIEGDGTGLDITPVMIRVATRGRTSATSCESSPTTSASSSTWSTS